MFNEKRFLVYVPKNKGIRFRGGGGTSTATKGTLEDKVQVEMPFTFHCPLFVYIF